MSIADFPPLKKNVQPKTGEDASKDLGNSKPPSNLPPFETDGARPKNFARDKQSFLEERAKHLQMPTAEEAELVPKYLFDDPVFIIHMCSSCRSMSRNLPAFNLDSEYQKIELKLCRICRATYNCQRRIKFFKHDLLCVKRKYDNRNT